MTRNTFFGVNLVQKIIIVSFSWKLISKLIWICTIQWWCSLFLFYTKNPFLSNLGLKIKIVSLNWNLVLNVLGFFSIYDWKYLFRADLVHKIKIVNLSWNFVLRLTEYAEVDGDFDFTCFIPKIPSLAKFGIKIKIVSLSWSFKPWPIWICWIQWWCSLLLFFDQNTLYGKIWSKKSKLSVSAETWY